jgi:hypothetical protein
MKIGELELETERRGQGFEDSAASGNDLFADTISGDET